MKHIYEYQVQGYTDDTWTEVKAMNAEHAAELGAEESYDYDHVDIDGETIKVKLKDSENIRYFKIQMQAIMNFYCKEQK